jgi:hypothetical protein
MKRIINLGILSLLIMCTGFGQTIERKQYTAKRIITPPVINGILDDESWKSGTWAGDFT